MIFVVHDQKNHLADALFFILTNQECSGDNSWKTAKVSISTKIDLVAHAGGGTPWGRYSNSLEALDGNYSIGHRLFEIDFRMTRDKKIVALRDWRQRFKYWYPYSNQTPTNALKVWWQLFSGESLDHRLFMQLSNRCGLTQIDTQMLTRWMVAHPDATIISDLRTTNIESATRALYDGLSTVADRVIFQVGSTEELEYGQRFGFSRFAWRSYRSAIAMDIFSALIDKYNLEAAVYRKDYLLNKSNIFELYKIKSLGLDIWTFTVNSPLEIQAFPGDLVDAAMTDALAPTNFERAP